MERRAAEIAPGRGDGRKGAAAADAEEFIAFREALVAAQTERWKKEGERAFVNSPQLVQKGMVIEKRHEISV